MKKLNLIIFAVLCFTTGLQAQTHNWDFNSDVNGSMIDGWRIINYTNPTSTGGFLTLTAANSHCNIQHYVSKQDAINPAISKFVTIRLKNTTSDTVARFFWKETPTSPWVSKLFAITKNDEGFKEYTIDMSDNANWKSVVAIRFDIPEPTSTLSMGKNIIIDYIKLYAQKP